MYKGKWLCAGLHLYNFFSFYLIKKNFLPQNHFFPTNISLNRNLQNRYKQASLLELQEISKY